MGSVVPIKPAKITKPRTRAKKVKVIVDDNHFNNSITDKPLPSIERLACFIKNVQGSSNATDILQGISAAAQIEVFARELKAELDNKRKTLILALGGKVEEVE